MAAANNKVRSTEDEIVGPDGKVYSEYQLYRCRKCPKVYTVPQAYSGHMRGHAMDELKQMKWTPERDSGHMRGHVMEDMNQVKWTAEQDSPHLTLTLIKKGLENMMPPPPPPQPIHPPPQDQGNEEELDLTLRL